jgi:hypothetical protein
MVAFSLQVKKVKLELQAEPMLGLVDIVLKYPSSNLSLDKRAQIQPQAQIFLE